MLINIAKKSIQIRVSNYAAGILVVRTTQRSFQWTKEMRQKNSERSTESPLKSEIVRPADE